MIKEAINRIIELSGIHLTEIDGRTYAKGSLSPVYQDAEHEPDVIVFHTLDGLLDYAQSLFQVDKHCAPGNARLHIVNEQQVDLIGPVQHNNKNRRFTYAKAELIADRFSFGQWIDQERFIIALMSKFQQDFETSNLVSKVASITGVSERLVEDDGSKQIVKIRTGLRLEGEQVLENPVRLAPYRTFREIKEQPKSEFIIRMRTSRDANELVLYEADGAQWRLDAIDKIREYLQDRMYDWEDKDAVLGVIS